ncbi:MAG: glycosyltransferase family protein [Selenomonadaceae bacterium]|nr:glycosyltransferase family protein [Selenomonadaceae bacterium]
MIPIQIPFVKPFIKKIFSPLKDAAPNAIIDKNFSGADPLDNHKCAFITCVNDDDWYSECALYINHLNVPAGFSVELIPVRGATAMTVGYQHAMTSTNAKYKVYLHQDTLVVNKNLIGDLLNIFSDPTVGAVGVIGCKNLPRSGVWWDGLRTYGRVLHACEPESVVDSHCSEPDAPIVDVQSVDGLFIATQYDLPWRTDLFDGWHLYDTSLCMEMQRAGYRVVVPNQQHDFWCVHCPKEKPLAPAYKHYQKIFLREYGAELNPEV